MVSGYTTCALCLYYPTHVHIITYSYLYGYGVGFLAIILSLMLQMASELVEHT